MIVRVQFTKKESGSTVFPWALFKISVDNSGSISLREGFHGIVSGSYSCGKVLSFDEYDMDSVRCMVATVNVLPKKSDLMCAPLEICLNDIKQNNIINFASPYPKCESCKEKPDVPRRKRKSVVAADFVTKKKK